MATAPRVVMLGSSPQCTWRRRVKSSRSNRGGQGGGRAGGAASGGRHGGQHAKGEDTRHVNRQRGRDDVERTDPRRSEPDRDEELSGAVAELDAEIGPYDVTEAPAGIAHLDLGALRVPAVEGVEVRVQ